MSAPTALPSLQDILQRTTTFLTGKGVPNARRDAEWIIGHALGLNRMQVYLQFERPLTEPELASIRPLVRRRAAREPLPYILGTTEFGELELKVDRRALIPRPETEYLLELLTARTKGLPSTILDLGCGSGALGLALARQHPSSQVTLVDISADAAALATENAVHCALADRCEVRVGSWFAPLDKGMRFDLIVANPPYLSAEETAEVGPEIRDFEPAIALTAANAGRADLDHILGAGLDWLVPGGMLAMETGTAHHAALRERATSLGYALFESLPDLAGRDRFVVATAPV